MEHPPRRHHYLPAFYLSGFTVEGGRDSRLYVIDRSQAKSWPSTPDKSGHQRDFYAVDLGADVHPSAFESKVLSKLDGQFSQVVRNVVTHEQLPASDDFNTLLNFVAVGMTRVPRTRRLVDRVTSHVLYDKIKSLLSTEEGWSQFLALSQEDGKNFTEEELRIYRQSILDEGYEIKLDNTSQVQKMDELVDGLLPQLAERTWSVEFAAEKTPDLVCSDAPVSLVPNDKFSESDQLHLTNEHTIVMMPLTRRAALLGTFEDRPPTFKMNEYGVLSINSHTMLEARQVFSASENIAYLGRDGRPKGSADLLQEMASQEGKYSNLDFLLDNWLQKHAENE